MTSSNVASSFSARMGKEWFASTKRRPRWPISQRSADGSARRDLTAWAMAAYGQDASGASGIAYGFELP